MIRENADDILWVLEISGTLPETLMKRKQAEKRARRERKEKFMTIFLNGRQKRVPRPPLIEGLPVEEFIRRHADPVWLHANECWDLLEARESVWEDALEELRPRERKSRNEEYT